MAVIRCPNCAKPNPDFLEVCQYCDAKLRPEGGAPPVPTGAPSSAEETLIRKPEAAPTPSSEPAPEGEPLDWMSRLRRISSEVPSGAATPAARVQAEEPDWMWTSQAGDTRQEAPPAATAGAAQDSAVELPEWLRDLDEPTDKTHSAPASPAAQAEPAVADHQPTATPAPQPSLPAAQTSPLPARPRRPATQPSPLPAPEPSPFEPTASDETIRPRPRRKMTDWLNKVKEMPPAPAAPEPEPQAVPNTSADLPDWLKAIGAEAEAPDSAAPAIEAATQPQGGPAAAPTPEDELPEWLRAMRNKNEAPAPVPGTAALQSSPPSGTGASPPARRVQELPQGLRPQTPDDTLIPRPGAKPLVTPTDDMPDWLKGILATRTQDAAAAESGAAAESAITASSAVTPAAAPDITAPAESQAAAVAPSTDATASTVAAAYSNAAPSSTPVSVELPTAGTRAQVETPAAAAPEHEKPAIDETLPPPTHRGKHLTDWRGSVPAPAASATPAAEELPDWLKSLSAESAANVQPTPPAAPVEALPDWLKSAAPEAVTQPPARQATNAPEPVAPIAGAQLPTAAPPEPEPAASEAPVEDLPDWLKALAPVAPPQAPASEAAPTPAAPVISAPADQTLPPRQVPASPAAPAAALAVTPTEEDNLPDWLKAITRAQVTEMTSSQDVATAPLPAPEPLAPTTNYPQPIAVEHAPGRAAVPAATPAEEEDLPGWLKAITQASATAATAAVTDAAASGAAAFDAETTLVPDASRSTTVAATAIQPAVEAPTPEAPAGPIAPLASGQGPASPTTTAPSATPLPPWLEGVGTGPLPDMPELDTETLAWLAEAQKAEPAPEAAGLDLTAARLPPEKPAWLDELAAVTAASNTAAAAAAVAGAPEIAPTPVEELPEWLRALRGQTAEEEEAAQTMPDWLRALRGLPPGVGAQPVTTTMPVAVTPAATTAAAPSGLEQAALPAWLAAMRPVDIGLPVATESDSYQETLGVLAGMRGVLRAEPVVAQPHKAITPVHNLAVSETHTTHANLLTELLRAETVTRLVRRVRGRVRLSALAERWAVFAVLLVALVLAQFQAQLQLPVLFAPPSASLPPEAAPVYSLVEGLPKGKPALVAFDYDASQEGELDPGARAVVGHLARHGSPVVAVSLRLTGAAVAQQMLSETATSGYVNLGFIPGGPVGLLQFAAAPQSMFRVDFSGKGNVWSTPIISNVRALTDFGLIVLVSGTPESTRAWMEQAQSFAGSVPTVAVVSAGAEPMVRPYYDDPDANSPLKGELPIKGLIVGLGGAAAYERATSSPGTASTLWPALGGGLLAAAVVITLGNLFFAVAGVLRRRKA